MRWVLLLVVRLLARAGAAERVSFGEVRSGALVERAVPLVIADATAFFQK